MHVRTHIPAHFQDDPLEYIYGLRAIYKLFCVHFNSACVCVCVCIKLSPQTLKSEKENGIRSGRGRESDSKVKRDEARNLWKERVEKWSPTQKENGIMVKLDEKREEKRENRVEYYTTLEWRARLDKKRDEETRWQKIPLLSSFSNSNISTIIDIRWQTRL